MRDVGDVVHVGEVIAAETCRAGKGGKDAAEQIALLGDKVTAININPVGHTRLPRYVRGKTGTVARDHGVFAFPDTSVSGVHSDPQHVYSVRFEGEELWGKDANPKSCLYIDMFDTYLEPA